MARRLLPLLMLVALLVPRGARLTWCVCLEPPDADCCATLCCAEARAPEAPEAPAADAGGADAPDCCVEIEVDDFAELLVEDGPALPGPALVAVLPAAPPAPRACAGPTQGAERAPPRPPGLLPGVRPLRI